MVNPVQLSMIYFSTVVAFLVSIMLRVFIIAIILVPFFGLIHHARREGGGVVTDLSAMLKWMYLRFFKKVPSNYIMHRLLNKVRLGDGQILTPSSADNRYHLH